MRLWCARSRRSHAKRSVGGGGGPDAGWRLAFSTAERMTAEELARRLITLIFAGRNRRDMIRRQLPRTRRAGLGRSRFRIEHEEGSPFRGSCAVIGAAVQGNIGLFG